MFSSVPGPIGIFDSGYGGLTIFDKIRAAMPGYDYIYLGDNARSPYGTRSFEVVYRFTKQAVETLFNEGCQLVILACNTASAKALRTIQQRDLPQWDPARRVLGVIRPTVELMDKISKSKHVGILGTTGTITSDSYSLEIKKMFPHMTVTGEACPMWVPLVENNEFDSPGADYFVRKHLEHILAADPEIDTLVLGCTHYPLLIEKIKAFLPEGITLFSQGEYVAASLTDYLRRHPEMDIRLTKQGNCRFLTTESAAKFSDAASVFLNHPVEVEQHVGILGTTGTITSDSYSLEIKKMFPHMTVTGEACPMWVPLVENNEFDSPGADYFVRKHLEHILAADPEIDTLVLGCTHYPLLIEKIKAFLPEGITLFSQGEYVAASLTDYLRRHPEMDIRLTKQGNCRFLTTESAAKFSDAASVFLNHPVEVEQIRLVE